MSWYGFARGEGYGMGFSLRAHLRENYPWLRPVRDEVVFQVKRPYRWLWPLIAPWNVRLPDGRNWGSLINTRLHVAFNRGAMAYTYRGMKCIRYPVDLALLLLILQELRPRTVIELGSKEGGSAAFYGDMMELLGRNGRVYSIDLEKPDPKYRPYNVSFHKGDENHLEGVPLAWGGLPHPWLVINDASHQYSGIMNCLAFLRHYMVKGDMLVVEDGWLTQTGMDRKRKGGPGRAIADFLKANEDWKIDARYCDFFGRNVTSNPNGYLVKS